MKFLPLLPIATLIFLIAQPLSAIAASECDKAGSYGRKIYLQKALGMTLERYRQIEGAPPHPVLDIIEKAIFNAKIKNEDHAALVANTICNKYFAR